MTRDSERNSTHILIVEDNPADVDLLRRALQSAELNCELTVIDDGAEALQFVSEADSADSRLAPALAIIDLNVPKHDGAEILKKIRTSRRLADLPVLIMSSSSSPRDRARLFELGIGRYVTKPADLDEFLKIGQVVKELLGGQ